MRPYPLLFEPILKEKVWGGRRLEALGKRLPEGLAIGESWELADLPDSVPGGRSVVRNGPLAGRTLRSVTATLGEALMGPVALTPEGGFPLLLKYLDARESLSVQVHPDAEYVRRHPEAHLKSEAWVVLLAEPGAVIYKGVRPEIGPGEFARHVAEGRVADDLVAVPVAPGDCHYLPSGTCHALGAGVLVAEVQTPSDTTFRVHDWGRTGRRLHVEQALECIRFGDPPEEAPCAGVPICVDGIRTTPLVRTGFFGLERVEADDAARYAVETSGQPEAWMVTAGAADLDAGGGDATRLETGVTALLPAALETGGARLAPGTSLLRVTLPSPVDGLLAAGDRSGL